MDQQADDKNINISKKKIRKYQIILPIVIGVGVIIAMFINEFGKSDFGEFPDITISLVASVLVGILCVVGRDFFMTLRFRIVTCHQLSWLQAFRVCMLCEFTSAITPSSVGGSALGMFFMNREGINLGKATTQMLITIFLDELFFVISCPLILCITPFDELFGNVDNLFANGINVAFWTIYGAIAAWTLVLFTGIILKPQLLHKVIETVFKIRLLHRWKEKAVAFADNMVVASEESKLMTLNWWIRAFFATAMSWISRYLLVCALFITFVPYSDQWLVFARQSVVWLVLMVCPTPGGSGLSEWLFTKYYADMVASGAVALFIATLWRLLSYYIYLIIGVFVIPTWMKGRTK